MRLCRSCGDLDNTTDHDEDADGVDDNDNVDLKDSINSFHVNLSVQGLWGSGQHSCRLSSKTTGRALQVTTDF